MAYDVTSNEVSKSRRSGMDTKDELSKGLSPLLCMGNEIQL